MKAKSTLVTVIGLPSFRADIFSGDTAELTISLSANHDGRTYSGLAVLRLSIERYSDVVRVQDYYSDFIPYLKPIREFRVYFCHWLRKFLMDNPEHQGGIIGSGIQVYSDMLESYSEAKGLVRQVTSQIRALEKRPDAEQCAREILNILGVVPNTDIGFGISPL